MRRLNRPPRPIARRTRPALDGLESRALLSGPGDQPLVDLGLPPADTSSTSPGTDPGDGLLGIVGSQPGPGATSGPVTRLVVTFAEPLSPYSVDPSALRLDRRADDGS